MAKVYVKDLRDKEQVKSVFQVVRKTSTSSKSGKPFLAVVLCDRTGELDARIWDRIDEYDARFDRGDLVSVEGALITFQGHLQLKIDSLEKAELGEGLEASDFAPPPKAAPGDRNFQQVLEMVERIQDPHVKAMVRSFLDDPELADAFKRAPAAKSVHHARPGGLCEHTLSVMRLAARVAEHYPMVDRDLLIGGAFLHDFAKVKELSYERQTEYTDEGRLVGHLVMMAQWIHERAQRLPDFPRELAAHLSHIVLSHHGVHEFGSPRLPQTLEALVLHAVDELDSRIAGWLEVMQRDSGETWTDFQKLYDRHLFKGTTPTVNAKTPVEKRRRRRGDRPERGERPERHERPEGGPAGEAEAAAPAPAHAEQGERERPAQSAEARPQQPPREKRDRPPRGRPEKPEEKLTFKPFAALAPPPPAAPAPASAPEASASEPAHDEAAPAPEEQAAPAAPEPAATPPTGEEPS